MRSLLVCGDDLIAEGRHRRGELGTVTTKLTGIILELLSNLPVSMRKDALIEDMAESKSLRLASQVTSWLGEEHGMYQGGRSSPTGSGLLPAEVREVEALVLRRIAEASTSSELLRSPELAGILWFWRTAGGSDMAARWVGNICKSDAGLLTVLESFTSVSIGTAGGRVRTHLRLNPHNLEPYLLDIRDIDARATRLLKQEWLSDHQRAILAEFRREYAVIERGDDPDLPWNRDDPPQA